MCARTGCVPRLSLNILVDVAALHVDTMLLRLATQIVPPGYRRGARLENAAKMASPSGRDTFSRVNYHFPGLIIILRRKRRDGRVEAISGFIRRRRRGNDFAVR